MLAALLAEEPGLLRAVLLRAPLPAAAAAATWLRAAAHAAAEERVQELTQRRVVSRWRREGHVLREVPRRGRHVIRFSEGVF